MNGRRTCDRFAFTACLYQLMQCTNHCPPTRDRAAYSLSVHVAVVARDRVDRLSDTRNERCTVAVISEAFYAVLQHRRSTGNDGAFLAFRGFRNRPRAQRQTNAVTPRLSVWWHLFTCGQGGYNVVMRVLDATGKSGECTGGAASLPTGRARDTTLTVGIIGSNAVVSADSKALSDKCRGSTLKSN